MPSALPPSFPLPLRLERTGPMKAELELPFVFLSPSLGRIEVEAGFDTDYASVPRAFWAIFPPDGDYTEAAVIHDALYWYQTAGLGRPAITRAQADAVFLEALASLGIGWLTRRTLYTAVRVGGWLPWSRNTKAKAADPITE